MTATIGCGCGKTSPDGIGWSIDHEGIWHWGEQRTPAQWAQAAAHKASSGFNLTRKAA